MDNKQNIVIIVFSFQIDFINYFNYFYLKLPEQ
jgi:hypothetical protein